MFVESRGKSLGELLVEFERLRQENLETLEAWQLSDENLRRTGTHPDLGTVTLGQLLATRAVHDLGHIVQISRVMARRYTEEVGPWSEYLGVLER